MEGFQQEEESLVLNSGQKVFDHFHPRLHREKKEHLFLLCLDTQSHLMLETRIAARLISVGSLNTAVAHPREIFAPAIACSAASVILVHNHTILQNSSTPCVVSLG